MSEAAYHDHAVGPKPEQFLQRMLLQSEAELERHSAIAANIPEDAQTLLDVGCGFGLLLKTLRDKCPGLRAIGLERSEPAAATGQRLFGVDIVRGSADSLPFPDGAFDVVTACEVLEHLPCGIYESALKEIQRVARSAIVVSVPFQERRQLARCPHCKCRFDPCYHMREFDERILRNLFETFDAVSVMRICWSKHYVVSAIRHWLREGRGKSNFPLRAFCPQCGFRNTLSGQVDQPSGSQQNWARLLARRLLRWIPVPSRPRWAIAVYRPRFSAKKPCSCQGQ